MEKRTPFIPPLLEIQDISVFYGDALALRNVTMTVAEGVITVLLGSNGAGKSTLLKTVTGRLKARQGRIYFRKRDLSFLPPFGVVREGIASVPEGRELFTSMSVSDNLLLGTYPLRRDKRKKMLVQRLPMVFELFPVLQKRLRQAAETLSGGEQQMLALGRALMADPKLLVLDEPSLGLSPLLVREMMNLLKAITRKLRISILLAEQNAGAAMEIADYVYILENGTIKAEGTRKTMTSKGTFLSAYLGT